MALIRTLRLEAHQAFHPSERFAPSGEQVYRVPRRTASKAIRLPTQEFVTAVAEAVDNHLLSASISKVAPRSLGALFVEPPLSFVSQRQLSLEKKAADSSIYVSLRDLCATGEPVIFVGQKESGKTTLLHRICSQATDFSLVGFPPFATYVDLHYTRDTKAKLLEAATQFGGGAYRRAEFVELLREGQVALCFDNVEKSDTRQLAALSEFLREYPRCRYYFSILESFETSLSHDALPHLGLVPKVVYIHSFGRRETRELTRKWFGDTDQALIDKVDGILGLLSRLNIPRSPFLISALLWIKESQLNFAPVNHSSILDVLIDGILEKLTESKDRSGIDSVIKRHFLAALAETLYSRNTRAISVADLDQFAVEYFAKRALKSATGPFLEELKSRGLLVQLGDVVVFKFDCMRAYFLAARLRESPRLLETAFSTTGFLSLADELDYFSGSTRDRADLVSRSLELLAEFHAAVELDLDLGLFNDVFITDTALSTDGQAAVAEKILGSRVSAEERERLLDAVDQSTVNKRLVTVQTAPAPLAVEPFARFLEALQIASRVLRNSELVDDVELKRKAYAEISSYWSEVVIAALVCVDFVAEDPKALSALANTLALPEGTSSQFTLKLILPIAVMSIAFESLGSTKLQLILQHAIDERGESVKQVFDSFLYVKLGFQDKWSKIEALLRNNEGNKLVAGLVLIIVSQWYLLGSNTEADESIMRKLIGMALAAVGSATTQVGKDRLKSRVIERLQKMRLAKTRN